MGVLRAADQRPAAYICGALALCYVGLEVWACLASRPVLLARASPDHRAAIYGQLASSAVAMLGISLTVLAILVALPDRPGVTDLRSRRTWRLLQGGLLATAAFCLACVLGAQLGTAVDTDPLGMEWLGNLVLASAFAVIISVLTFGSAFWLALRRADDPVDPADRRRESI